MQVIWVDNMNWLVQPAVKHTKIKMYDKTDPLQVHLQTYFCDQAKTSAAKSRFCEAWFSVKYILSKQFAVLGKL